MIAEGDPSNQSISAFLTSGRSSFSPAYSLADLVQIRTRISDLQKMLDQETKENAELGMADFDVLAIHLQIDSSLRLTPRLTDGLGATSR
ncbi:hypothetical protein [Mesorhizobium helmanticense]|uniref:hypothetical protein n=1 Tax=Mesorhizobium helmanticense TaxID=1776423 RepID=UPI0011B22960|nr:hypothetical protein [Mesorhizobium helmanticense]